MEDSPVIVATNYVQTSLTQSLTASAAGDYYDGVHTYHSTGNANDTGSASMGTLNFALYASGSTTSPSFPT